MHLHPLQSVNINQLIDDDHTHDNDDDHNQDDDDENDHGEIISD